MEKMSQRDTDETKTSKFGMSLGDSLDPRGIGYSNTPSSKPQLQRISEIQSDQIEAESDELIITTTTIKPTPKMTESATVEQDGSSMSENDSSVFDSNNPSKMTNPIPLTQAMLTELRNTVDDQRLTIIELEENVGAATQENLWLKEEIDLLKVQIAELEEMIYGEIQRFERERVEIESTKRSVPLSRGFGYDMHLFPVVTN